jgi:hypothetical protein
MRESQVRFIRQQGCSYPNPDDHLYDALMLQPRIVGAFALLGILFQAPWLFLALSALLWWSALVPTRNPFDALYNFLVAHRRGRLPLGSAPAPRRFASSMAATLTLGISIALMLGARRVAWICEGLLAAAVATVVFGGFCAGSYLYYVLRRPFARRSVPVQQRC